MYFQFQLQFFCCVVHMGYIVFKPDCAYPRWTSAVFLPQNLFMLVLFTDFYIKTYVRKPIVKTDEDKKKDSNKYNANNINDTLTINQKHNLINEDSKFKEDIIRHSFENGNTEHDILHRFHKHKNIL